MATSVRMVTPLLMSARAAADKVHRCVSYLPESGWPLVHDC
jgi:hypothetical protein